MKSCIQSFIVFLAGFTVSVTGVTAAENKDNFKDSDFASDSTIDDPFENWNRGVFAFNNTLDKYILEPVSIAYDAVTPDVLRLIVNNELDYIQSPISIANSILQGDIDVMLHTTGRFFINTTFGGLGLLDAASSFGLKPHHEDFGQTLAVWGVSDGGYYVAPVLGSMTFRDLGGKVTDFAFTPSTYVGDYAMYAVPAITAVGIVDFRASNSEFISNLKESSSDYYTTVKTIYIQKRNSDIKNATFDLDNNDNSEFIHFDE